MAEVVVVGSYIQDLTFHTPEFPRPGETRIGTFVTGPGGKGSNQAVACHRQGVSTMFLGAVGNDVFAAGYREFCQHEGLRAELETIPGVATGAAAIVVDAQARNLITVSLGASGRLSPEHIDRFRDEFRGAKAVVTQLECQLSAVRKALELGRSAGAACVLNPAPINPALTRELLDDVHILVPNESEFADLLERFTPHKPPANFAALPDDDLRSLCQSLGVPTLILTLGEQGCVVAHQPTSNGTTADHDAASFYRVPPVRVQPVDTTGAGDAFTGGLAAGLVKYRGDLQAAVRYATVVAGLSTERPGTAPAMPTAAEVTARMSRA